MCITLNTDSTLSLNLNTFHCIFLLHCDLYNINETLLSTYFNPPVAGSTVIHSYSAVGQGVAEPAAMHVTEGSNSLCAEDTSTAQSHKHIEPYNKTTTAKL